MKREPNLDFQLLANKPRITENFQIEVKNRLKKFKWKGQAPVNIVLKDKHGNVIFEQSDIEKKWTEYIEDLFNDGRPGDIDLSPEDDDSGAGYTLESEVEEAMRKMKNRKAPGNYKILREIMLTACGNFWCQKDLHPPEQNLSRWTHSHTNEIITVYSNSKENRILNLSLSS